MSDEELVQAFVTASIRRVRRLANLVGGGALVLFALGILGAAVITPTLGLLMVLGGILLMPGLYLSRRAAHLTGPSSQLAKLLHDPTKVTGAEIERATRRGVVEESLCVKTAAGQATYPVAWTSTFTPNIPPRLLAAGVTAEALHAAVHRRAGLPQ
jgi:hypothetical protein